MESSPPSTLHLALLHLLLLPGSPPNSEAPRTLARSKPQSFICAARTLGKRVTGGNEREEEGTKVGLLPLDLSLAFPQATPASIFPPSVSDYYQFDDLLNNEEQSIRKKVRVIMEKEIAPIMTVYWEKAEFPFHAISKLASLGVAGSTIKGYGCPGLSITASTVTMAEIALVDARCSTFVLLFADLRLRS